MSLKEQIQQADDRGSETVEVPEWGVTLELRSPSVAERSALIAAMARMDGEQPTADDFTRSYVLLVIATAHDPETGERVFDDDDAGWLSEKSGAVLNGVWEAAQRVAGLDLKAVEAGKGDS